MTNKFHTFFEAMKIIISSEIKDRKALGVSFWFYNCRMPCKNLKRYENIHEGEQCFIVGTGPSLTTEDVDKLKGYISFGVNTLFKVYGETNWRADYYCIIDPKTYSNIRQQLEDNNVDNIFIAQNRMRTGFNVKNCIPFNLECSSFYKLLFPNFMHSMKFSKDITKCIYDGASVVYATLQLAVYMGFKDIYLLGVDCNYDTTVVHAGGLDYSKDYDYMWTKQTGITMIEGFKVAKEYADRHGIRIYNATRGGMLEVFPRVNLDEVIDLDEKE